MIYSSSLLVLTLTGYQAVRPFRIHLSGPIRFWSQSVCVLRFPVCQWVPGESHKTCKLKWLQLLLSTQHFYFNLDKPLCFVFLCVCVCVLVSSPMYDCTCQVDEVMLTLKQAFTTAAALQSNKTEIQLCQACPMHDLHKLCERIEGKPRKLSHTPALRSWAVSESWSNIKTPFLFPPLFPGLYPPRAKIAIQKYLSQLTDNEQVEIFERVQVRFGSA